MTDKQWRLLLDLIDGKTVTPCFLMKIFSYMLIGMITSICSCNRHQQQSQFTAVMDDKTITLRYQDKAILSYHRAVHPTPEGESPLYQRNGFIHPLYSPSGKVLTRIQPPDHYHHYGIWNPWTKTHIEGREVDFWNLDKGQGTVRFAGVESMTSGTTSCGFSVKQDHIDFTGDKNGKTVIQEIWDVRAEPGNLDHQPVWIVDFTSTFQNVLNTPIELAAFRYGGGIGFRATELWNKDNCSVITSEGKTRNDADGTRARWCDVNGEIANNETAGVLFLSHPDNREHPEPMRVWPDDANKGRGDLFFEFCPIRHHNWILDPGKDYTLQYRLIVYDGKIKSETAEELWQNYIHLPSIRKN